MEQQAKGWTPGPYAVRVERRRHWSHVVEYKKGKPVARCSDSNDAARVAEALNVLAREPAAYAEFRPHQLDLGRTYQIPPRGVHIERSSAEAAVHRANETCQPNTGWGDPVMVVPLFASIGSKWSGDASLARFVNPTNGPSAGVLESGVGADEDRLARRLGDDDHAVTAAYYDSVGAESSARSGGIAHDDEAIVGEAPIVAAHAHQGKGVLAVLEEAGSWLPFDGDDNAIRERYSVARTVVAHLIAAAPLMFEALGAIERLESSPLQRDYVPPEIQAMARAALSAARGEK